MQDLTNLLVLKNRFNLDSNVSQNKPIVKNSFKFIFAHNFIYPFDLIMALSEIRNFVNDLLAFQTFNQMVSGSSKTFLQLFIVKLNSKPILQLIFSNPLNKIFAFRRVSSNFVFFCNFRTLVSYMSQESSLLI